MTPPTETLPCPVTDVLSSGQPDRHFEEQAKPVDAVPTPLATWNRCCRDDGGRVGIARGWHVTVGGATGFGKTTFALNMAATAIQHGEQVGFVSLEMSKAQIATRLYGILTSTPVAHLERGETFSPVVAQDVAKQIAEIRERTGGGFVVNEEPVFDLRRILKLMRQTHAEHDCRFFVVDYIQLAGGSDYESLLRQVTNVSGQVREFAKQHHAITVGLSQLNRETSKEYKLSPTPQGLMGGSPLENDSDQVVLLDHSRFKRTETGAETYVILGKNRHGSQGTIPIEWDYRTLRVGER